jgi:hypothetical protein
VLDPDGWRGNWFASATRSAARFSATASLERATTIAGRPHDLTFSLETAARGLSGHLAENPIQIENADGRVTRTISFGPPTDVHGSDRRLAVIGRDVWQLSSRTQIDAGLRLDARILGGSAVSARAGIRHALDAGNVTVIKAGVGKFVGTLPLGVPAFGDYPSRIDRRFDAATGALTREIDLQPTLGELRLPQAVAATFTVERQLGPNLDVQAVLTDRHSTKLAVLRVPDQSGPLVAESTGTSDYYEQQFSVRRLFGGGQQVFASYVHSNGRGELNDFTSLFGFVDAPLLQPGALARLSTEATNRVIAWGTVNLPWRIVLSPVMEWRSGFPYSVVDEQYVYSETPNSRTFPAFFDVDLIAYKTVTVKKRSADLGVQIFNVTDHRNPRDVYAVSDAPKFGTFTNSVGTIIRGYMLVKW